MTTGIIDDVFFCVSFKVWAASTWNSRAAVWFLIGSKLRADAPAVITGHEPEESIRRIVILSRMIYWIAGETAFVYVFYIIYPILTAYLDWLEEAYCLMHPYQ